LTEKRLGGRGRGGSSGTWHAIAFDRRNPFVWVYFLNYHYSHRTERYHSAYGDV